MLTIFSFWKFKLQKLFKILKACGAFQRGLLRKRCNIAFIYAWLSSSLPRLKYNKLPIPWNTRAHTRSSGAEYYTRGERRSHEACA